MTWQPIETAPKDGKTVLVYDLFEGSKDGLAIVAARFTDAHGWHVSASVIGGNYQVLTKPASWMPLPPAPEATS